MPRVKVAYENLPNEAEVEIPYLGVFRNNTETEVEQWKWDRFVRFHPAGSDHEDTQVLEFSTSSAEERSDEAPSEPEAPEDLRLLSQEDL